jgi:hypothetical protein
MKCRAFVEHDASGRRPGGGAASRGTLDRRRRGGDGRFVETMPDVELSLTDPDRTPRALRAAEQFITPVQAARIAICTGPAWRVSAFELTVNVIGSPLTEVVNRVSVTLAPGVFGWERQVRHAGRVLASWYRCAPRPELAWLLAPLACPRDRADVATLEPLRQWSTPKAQVRKA